jgi:hypothetical protein
MAIALRSIVGEVPITVVENGVDLEYFRPGGDVQPHRLVFVGGMDWYPNREAVRFLVREIWPRLAAYEPNWRLAVIGRKPSEDLLAAARDPRVSAPAS